MNKVRVGVYGAAGYTAGELLRLLVFHPMVEIVALQSESQAGRNIDQVHKDLLGDLSLKFTSTLNTSDVDVVFLCKGHGESVDLVQSGQLDGVHVIDLSQDFRPRGNEAGFVYGLPELNKAQISSAKRVANPGCFATCIQLGILPAVSHQLVDSSIHISGLTGSTGAGQKLTNTSHFSWRYGNISVYKAFKHQHLLEIRESCQVVDDRFQEPIHFVPYRGTFTRGIMATSYFACDAEVSIVKAYYKDFYADSPFVHVVDENPDIKQVVNTNKALVYLEKHDDQLMVISVIDNLLKGASGQAVQNMNLMFGLDESLGLKLKSTAF